MSGKLSDGVALFTIIVKVTVLDKYPPLDAMVAETIDVPALFIVVLLPVIEITVGLVRTL